jgi:hypothetical protein
VVPRFHPKSALGDFRAVFQTHETSDFAGRARPPPDRLWLSLLPGSYQSKT